MPLARTPLVLLTSAKAFEDPWVGHADLNRLGLHTARIRLSDLLWRGRCRQRGDRRLPWLPSLNRDGIVVLEDFLPHPAFERVRREVLARVTEVEARTPVRYMDDRGFGPRRPFPGGFDRWDGGTLNRFVRVDRTLIETRRAARDLRRLGASSVGTLQWAEWVSIYQTVYESEVSDIQMRAHRDTFQPATKLWYFLEPVTEQDGPFRYAPGSHRLTRERLRWEHEQAQAAAARRRGGSFRIHPEQIEALGYGPLRSYPVRANTLVIANVRGFHCRGPARTGARRLALYGNFRPPAFLPVPL